MNIRKDDTVQVLAGDNAGATGRVLRVVTDTNRVVVEGVNKVYRHIRPSQRNPQGGRLSKEMPVDVSNVAVVCPTCQHGVRVGKRFTAEGRKERFCKKCKGGLGLISPVREKHIPK